MIPASVCVSLLIIQQKEKNGAVFLHVGKRFKQGIQEKKKETQPADFLQCDGGGADCGNCRLRCGDSRCRGYDPGEKAGKGSLHTGGCRVGYGKRVRFSDFNPHGRGTGGQKVCGVNDKTGEIIAASAVAEDDEVVCITSQGKTLRLKASGFSLQGRAGHGVKVLNIESPDMVIGVDRIANEEDD